MAGRSSYQTSIAALCIAAVDARSNGSVFLRNGAVLGARAQPFADKHVHVRSYK